MGPLRVIVPIRDLLQRCYTIVPPPPPLNLCDSRIYVPFIPCLLPLCILIDVVVLVYLAKPRPVVTTNNQPTTTNFSNPGHT